MFDSIPVIDILGIAVVVAPCVLVAVLGISSLLERPLPEDAVGKLVQLANVVGLLAAMSILVLMLVQGTREVPIVLGNWVHVPHFHFSLKFVFGRLSVPLVILTFVLCGTIGAFANKYLHREPGFNRFFVLYALFVLGMTVASLAGTIETLFAGWELVGISSALLVAFFHERQSPVRNGLRVWSVYRVSDAGLLHLTGEGDFDKLMGKELSWPYGVAELNQYQALVVGSLLVFAAAGKSALVPFSGWLPRAMEGPTPSSAIFYGALSVHLGAYLLLRVSPILALSPWLAGAVIALGLATALFAALAGRVQTDIKSALSFASLTQVGIIVVEIGLGHWFVWLRYVALVHLLGHACLRTLQFLRASSLLQDYRSMENAIGARLAPGASFGPSWLPARLGRWLYRFALERGYLDAWLSDYVARSFLRVFQACDSLERRWTDWLAGAQSRESDQLGPSAGTLEDLS
jgi:NAD(P)H-quinone oxidoreductase subunit 5